MKHGNTATRQRSGRCERATSRSKRRPAPASAATPRPDEDSEIRRLLREQIDRAIVSQADTLLMRLLCAQLFHMGDVNDALLAWATKRSEAVELRAGCSIDVQLLCGAGLEPTRAFVVAHGSDEARAALQTKASGWGSATAYVATWRASYAEHAGLGEP